MRKTKVETESGTCTVAGRAVRSLGWVLMLFAGFGCGPSEDRTDSDNGKSSSGESVRAGAEFRTVDLNKIGFSPIALADGKDDMQYDVYSIPPSKIPGPRTSISLPLFRNGVRLRAGQWPSSGSAPDQMGGYLFFPAREDVGLLTALPKGADPKEWFSKNKYELRYTEPLPMKPGQFNVVIVIYDACRPDHLSCYGYGRKTSPVLDEIASGGGVFEQAVSQGGWTYESVASLFTGLLPPAHGSKYVFEDEASVPQDVKTAAELFADAGYSTALITSQEILLGENGYDQGFDIFDLGKAEDPMEFINRESGKPFFLVYYEINPHAPYTPAQEYNIFSQEKKTSLPGAESLDRARESLMNVSTKEEIETLMALYDGEILQNDQVVLKRIWEGLKSLNLVENTLFIFTADHGEAFWEHPGPRTGTWHDSTYEEVVRVPLIMSFPPLITPGLRVKDQVGLIDILPTLADLLRVDIPEHVQGRSLVPFLSDTEPKPEKIPYYSHTSGNNEWHALRTESWKLIVHDKGKIVELYNLENDPKEQTNLAEENPEILNGLHRRMKAVVEESFDIFESFNTKKEKISEERANALRNMGYIK